VVAPIGVNAFHGLHGAVETLLANDEWAAWDNMVHAHENGRLITLNICRGNITNKNVDTRDMALPPSLRCCV